MLTFFCQNTRDGNIFNSGTKYMSTFPHGNNKSLNSFFLMTISHLNPVRRQTVLYVSMIHDGRSRAVMTLGASQVTMSCGATPRISLTFTTEIVSKVTESGNKNPHQSLVGRCTRQGSLVLSGSTVYYHPTTRTPPINQTNLSILFPS